MGTDSPAALTGHESLAPPCLQVEGLYLKLAGQQIVNGVSLNVREGDINALLGPNGAGKSSLLNCINGIYRSDSGTIRLYDAEIQDLSGHEIYALGVGRTLQGAEVFRSFTVLETALLGMRTSLRRYGPLSFAIGMPHLNGAERAARSHAIETLELLGIASYRSTPLGEVPYGVAKLADFARVLVMRPKLALLDEPAAGLDEAERDNLGQVIRQIHGSVLTTALLVEHNLSLVSATCKNTSILAEGRVIFDGAVADAWNDETVKRVFLAPERTHGEPK